MSTFDRIRATRAIQVLALALSVTTLAACGSIKSFKDIPEYLDSDFENVGPRDFITKAELSRVKLGMSPLEVKNRIGAPMLSDKNEEGRWDYVIKQGQGASEEFLPYGVYFKDSKVVRIAALEKPPESNIAPSAPAPAAVAPAPVADAMPAASSDMGEATAISDMLSNWAAAWSSKDTAGYLGFYADDFQHGKKSRKTWESQRRARLSGPETISVTLTDIQVNMKSDTAATVSFKQEYMSNLYRDNGNKVLTLTKASGQWKIQKEEFQK